MGRVLALCMVLGSLAGAADRDRDGVDDALEQMLIEQFRPHFLVSSRECAQVPAEFEAFSVRPRVRAHNAAIYARVSPSTLQGPDGPALEIHYYHLWERDCGQLASHALDVEHVSALLVPSANGWTARSWYAAAHEGTVCDTSNAARAEAIGAVSSGPRVWISAGKHASYLSQELCRQRGCGGDDCRDMVDLPHGPLINLGEAQAPLNGAVWTASREWPFESKLGSAFHAELLGQLEESDDTVVARVNGQWRPTQFSISIGDDTIGALGTAGRHGDGGMAEAEEHTGNALGKTWRAFSRAMGHAARAVGLTESTDDPYE